MKKVFIAAVIMSAIAIPARSLTITPPINTITINGHTYTNDDWEANPQGTLSAVANDIAVVAGGTYMDDSETVSAAGNSQSGAATLSSSKRHHIVTGGSGGIKLPACIGSAEHNIVNNASSPVLVYPAGTDVITMQGGGVLAAGQPVPLTAAASFVCASTGHLIEIGQAVVGMNGISVADGGGALNVSIDDVSLQSILTRLGYQSIDASSDLITFGITDASTDGLTFPAFGCSGGGFTCGVCTINGNIVHVNIEVTWPNNSGTASPAIAGVPSTCFPSHLWVPHYTVGSTWCPVAGLNPPIATLNSDAETGTIGTPNGPGTIIIRKTPEGSGTLTNTTLKNTTCYFDFTFRANIT